MDVLDSLHTPFLPPIQLSFKTKFHNKRNRHEDGAVLLRSGIISVRCECDKWLEWLVGMLLTAPTTL